VAGAPERISWNRDAVARPRRVHGTTGGGRNSLITGVFADEHDVNDERPDRCVRALQQEYYLVVDVNTWLRSPPTITWSLLRLPRYTCADSNLNSIGT
jgi:hypothetical protein